MSNPVQQTAHLLVDLPGGGKIALMNQEEVDLWNASRDRYVEDYQLTQQNDLILVGAAITQQLIVFRAQQALAGMEPEFDIQGVPTGRYVRSNLKAQQISAAQSTLIKASEQIQAIEKSLGLDKKTREAGGTHTVANYVLTLKGIAREYGLHLQKRLTEYERVCMDARQRLRILQNADAEDLAYHNISSETICAWLRDELGILEELDKEFANVKQKLYLGKI